MGSHIVIIAMLLVICSLCVINRIQQTMTDYWRKKANEVNNQQREVLIYALKHIHNDAVRREEYELAGHVLNRINELTETKTESDE